MAIYRIIVASTEGGVIDTATRAGFVVLNPIRQFDEIDTLHNHSLGDDVGRLKAFTNGFVAIARKL